LISEVISLNSVSLDEGNGILRSKPRPVELRQKDYDSKFDSSTLFYDIYADGELVRLAGPPLLNLKPSVENLQFTVNGKKQLESKFTDLDRTQHSWLRFDGLAETMEFGGDLATASVRVGKSYTDIFNGKKALVTKSKNNDLRWIRDWVAFHVETQGVDAVLIYDNDSTEYSTSDLIDTLNTIDGLEVAIVVEWPFKFGPQGGNWGGVVNAPWDSDFTEYSILEHARYRFLKTADLVISADIDELVMSENGRSLGELMRESSAPGLVYEGRWITTVNDENNSNETQVSFKDFIYYDKNSKPTTQKWSIRPDACESATQWKTHSIAGVKLFRTKDVCHRHFLGISSNWKTKRTNVAAFDPDKHVVDIELVSALINSGIKQGNMLVSSLADPNRMNLEVGFKHKNRFMVSLANRIFSMERTFPLEQVHSGSNEILKLGSVLYGRGLAFEFKFYGLDIAIEIKAADEAAENWLKSLYRPRPQSSYLGPGRLLMSIADSRSGVDHVASAFFDQIMWLLTRAQAFNYDNPAVESVSSSWSIPTYWWQGRTNFGDLIGPLLVKGLTGREPKNMKDTDETGPCLVTVGSVLNLLERGGTEIWGSGLIAPLHAKSIQHLSARKPLKIHAVRGWRTYKELTQKLGWNVPRVFGDPALLLPRTFEPAPQASHHPVIIPHYQHAKHFQSVSEKFSVLDVERSAEEVVSDIANATAVVSTSLHGIIVAQAYGVPWIWLRIKDVTLAGDQFKFEDFFSVLNREQVAEISVESNQISDHLIRSLISRASLPKNKFDFNNLLDAFPRGFAL